jgi:hypothetical protein
VSGVQRQSVEERHAGREVTARTAAGPEGGVEGSLRHVVALRLPLGIGEGDEPQEGAGVTTAEASIRLSFMCSIIPP